MANPNWVDVDTLKSKLYADITGDTYDDLLTDLGEQITDRMLSLLDRPSWIDEEDPPLELIRAALIQANYEWRQRQSPGLSSVQYKDGNISKYQVGEFLDEVKSVIMRNRKYTLYPETAV
jgi:hypothetical protein